MYHERTVFDPCEIRLCSQTEPILIRIQNVVYSAYRSPSDNARNDRIEDEESDSEQGNPHFSAIFQKPGRVLSYESKGGHSVLWTFDLRNDILADATPAGWESTITGSLSSDEIVEPPGPSVTKQQREARSHFHRAIHTALQAGLAKVCRVSPIGFLKWMLPSREDDTYHQRLIFSMTLRTASNGNLTCLPEITSIPIDLVSHLSYDSATREIIIDRPILLAPLGIPAVLVDLVTDGEGGKWLPEAIESFSTRYPFLSRSLMARPTDWVIASPCSCVLSDAPEIEATDRLSSVLWPACLCLYTTETIDRAGDIQNPLFPDSIEAQNFEDPIRWAEEWFMGKSDREAAALSSVAGEAEQTEATTQSLEEESMLGQSPLYLRAVEPGSASAVYPTPPDGIMPGPVPTPTTAPATQNVDVSMEEDELVRVATNDTDQFPGLDMDDQDGAFDDNDDLFGDMDGDAFGDPDVTDADFNFFDESSKAAASKMHSDHPPIKTEDTTMSSDDKDHSAQGTADAPMHEAAAPSTSPHPLQISDIKMDNMEEDPAAQSSSALSRKGVATPPLSPVLVKDRLFPGSYFPPTQPTDGKNHHFTPITFKDAGLADSKYSSGGKFSSGRAQNAVSSPPIPLKRNISLRDFLNHYDDHGKKHFESGASKLARLKIINDDDDSDTESTITVHNEFTRNVRSRIEDDATTQKSPQQEGTKNQPRHRDLAQRLLQTHSMANEWEQVAENRPIASSLSGPHCLVTALRSIFRRLNDPRTALWDVFDFEGQDIIEVAQLLAVSSSCDFSATADMTSDMVCNPNLLDFELERCSQPMSTILEMKKLNLQGLAALSMSLAPAPNVDAASSVARPAPKRAHTNMVSTAFGQQLMPLIPPFVRIRRGDADWDVLSTATAFWETLGLEPANGPKDITADLVMVGSNDFRDSCLRFISDLQTVYEGCKLGQHAMGVKIHRNAPAANMGSPNDTPVRLLLITLKDALLELAKKVNQKARQHPSRTSVVYVFNPFREPGMTKYIYACFRNFQKELVVEAANTTLRVVTLPQIVCQDAAIATKHRTLTLIARSIYDRVESRNRTEKADLWTFFDTPSIELVSPISRKINFSISDTMPVNLLQEAQIIHLAYGVSADGRWLNAAWTDFTGNHQKQCTFCLYRADYDAVLASLKDFTSNLMPSITTWRLIVAVVGHSQSVDREIWSTLASSTIAVAVVEVCQSPPIQICSRQEPTDPMPPLSATPIVPQAASLTPVSTPQPASAISPDTHQVATPTPTDITNVDPTSIDPDAHLVDTRDESYALILPLPASRPRQFRPGPKPLASGLLLKRGSAIPHEPLPSLGVDVLVLTPPRMPQGTTTWLAPRSPEYVLREVLAWYRGLGLLGRLVGVPACKRGEVPWHVGVVIAAGEALEGFFD